MAFFIFTVLIEIFVTKSNFDNSFLSYEVYKNYLRAITYNPFYNIHLIHKEKFYKYIYLIMLNLN